MIWKTSLPLPENQAAREHVVDRLFLLGEAGEDVAHAERDETGNDFPEVTPGSPRKCDWPAPQIGDFQAEHLFPNRTLPRGAFKQSVVEPASADDDPEKGKNERDTKEAKERIDVSGIFPRMNLAKSGSHSRPDHDGNQDKRETRTQNETVNQ